MQLLWVPAFTCGHTQGGLGGEVVEPRWGGGRVPDGQQRAKDSPAAAACLQISFSSWRETCCKSHLVAHNFKAVATQGQQNKLLHISTV